MGWTVEAALEDPDIHVIRNEGSVFTFYLGDLSPLIKVNLLEKRGGLVWFKMSHLIKTPLQFAPYPSRLCDNTPGRALCKAVDGLASNYRSAIAAGHTPEDAWLVPF